MGGSRLLNIMALFMLVGAVAVLVVTDERLAAVTLAVGASLMGGLSVVADAIERSNEQIAYAIMDSIDEEHREREHWERVH